MQAISAQKNNKPDFSELVHKLFIEPIYDDVMILPDRPKKA